MIREVRPEDTGSITDIYNEYVSFRCYKGKVVPSIERRRKVEYMPLFKK